MACAGAEGPGYAEKVMRHLELHVFPWIGALAVEAILPTEVVRCLHRIKERGNLETAQRVREAVQHVFQYAVGMWARWSLPRTS